MFLAMYTLSLDWCPRTERIHMMLVTGAGLSAHMKMLDVDVVQERIIGKYLPSLINY